MCSLEIILSSEKDEDKASWQASYMRLQFPFFGIPKPQLDKLIKTFLQDNPIDDEAQLMIFMRNCWDREQREFQYVALTAGTKYKKLWTPNFLAFLKELIVAKSWWDTVDYLAANLVGLLIKQYPELITEMDRWVKDPNMWVRRSALLFQLKWKQETDQKRLFSYCLALQHEKEFFIRKAIGWALREYSKAAPNEVRTFLEANKDTLSPLSYKEGMKRLQKKS